MRRRSAAVRRLGGVVALVLGLGGFGAAPGTAIAQESGAAQAVLVRGVVSAQGIGATTRLIGNGSRLFEGDRVHVSASGFIVIEFTDGGRITLRPGTVFAITRYAHGGADDNLALQLFRGGMRAVTGLITRRNPQGYRITTVTATVGIRGTDFDARLCAEDCADEARRLGAAAAPAARVIGRVVQIDGGGRLSAAATGTPDRSLVEGAPLYEGDTVHTPAGARAAAVLRDGSRVALEADAAVRIEEFRHQLGDGRPDSVLLRLVKGGMRVLAGRVAERDPRAMQLAAANAVVGIRGTGLDMACAGACAPAQAPRPGEGLYVGTWQGAVEVRVGSSVVAVGAGQSAFVAGGAAPPVLLAELPPLLRGLTSIRPDRLAVDMERLFGVQAIDGQAPGLYVSVRDGHVAVTQGDRTIDLGAGEAAFADAAGGTPVRLEMPPAVLRLDPYPRPDQVTPEFIRTIEVITAPRGAGASAADNECEVR
ncbi:MAG: FecR domain-containing protein [Burkholderiales bacterium]|nr:FecR domain-containing protein [Burkholderiales bacterium]